MKRKKENPPKRSYAEVMEDLSKVICFKDERKILKELRKNHRKETSIYDRYPYLPLILSLISFLVSVTTILIVQLWKWLLKLLT